MTLSQLLGPELVLTKVPCSTKDGLIPKLVEQVYSTGRQPPYPMEKVLKTIDIREQIGGTLLPSGLSVPHARLRDYDGFILAVALPAGPIFHEGLQIRMMSLMISCQTGGPHYLTALAALTKISRDGEFFSRLCAVERAEDFIGILRERDPELA